MSDIESRRRLAAPSARFAAAALVSMVAACGSSGETTEEDERKVAMDTPRLTISEEGDGRVVKRYDTDGDGTPNVVEHIQHEPDPDNPNLTRKRLVEKRVDVNADGQFDIVKVYDEKGRLRKETIDDDFDGTRDRVSYYNPQNNSLARKELYADDGETVVKRRFYTGGNLDRVEADTDGDGTYDYFEYFSDGDLDRIGRDEDGDGEIDEWTHRSRERTADRSGTDAPTIPASEDSESGGNGGESE